MAQYLTGPFKIKRGVTSPPYRVLLRQANKQPVDLSQADHAHLVMWLRGQINPTVDSLATILQQGDAISGTNVGLAEYDWQKGDTDTPGVYDAEFALYDATGFVYARVPSDGYLEIVIMGQATVPVSLPVEIDLSLYHGDAWSQTFRLKDGAGLHDLSAATVAASARTANATTTALVATIANQTTNTGEIILSLPTDTSPFVPGSYRYDVQVTEASGVRTWIQGTLTIQPDVTP
jgi:hypothetical protein